MKKLIKTIPRIIRRCRARGLRAEFHTAGEVLLATTLGVPASIWWARIHTDAMNWFGVSITVMLAVGVWAFALKQLYAEVKIVAAFGEQK